MSMANWRVHVMDPKAELQDDGDGINIYSGLFDELIAISFINKAALDAFKAEIDKIVVKD